MSARAEAIKALVKPQAIKPKMPKGPKLKRLAFIAHPKLGKRIRSYMAKGQQELGVNPLKRFVSLRPGFLDAISVPFAGLVVCGVAPVKAP